MKRFLLTLLLLLPPARSVLGCECLEAGRFSAPNAVRASQAVFVGQAIKIELQTGLSARLVAVVEFAVSEAWKGIATPTLKLVTGAGGGDCGFPFEAGKEYLVFADQEYFVFADPGRSGQDQLSAHLCSYTAEAGESQAQEEVRQLRQWRRPKVFR